MLNKASRPIISPPMFHGISNESTIARRRRHNMPTTILTTRCRKSVLIMPDLLQMLLRRSNPAARLVQRRLIAVAIGDCAPGGLTPCTWAETFESLEHINFIGSVSGLHEPKNCISQKFILFHVGIEFISYKLSIFSAHVSGVIEPVWSVIGLGTNCGQPRRPIGSWW